MSRRDYDVVIVGSGAGGGTMAQELSSLCKAGARIALLERGPKLRPDDFSGKELEMCQALYQDGGAMFTAERTMTLALGSCYGGSTTVYTGTSLLPPERAINRWRVPGLDVADLRRRAGKYVSQNNVHFLNDPLINQNNQLFVAGCQALGFEARQFPINVRGCLGSSLCNLGCPNHAKQGTAEVQLPFAEKNGVETVTRCEVQTIKPQVLKVNVAACPMGAKGEPSAWEPGEYEIHAGTIVLCAGAVNSPALLLRSGFRRKLPRLGRNFTCHPAFIMVAEHDAPITNFVGHPKSFYLDQFAESDRFVLETCMYFPFVTAKSLAGFGHAHECFMQAFPRLQMILVLACDEADEYNRVDLESSGNATVHYHFNSAISHALVRGAFTAAKIFFAAGARRTHVPVACPSVLDRGDASRLSQIEQNSRFVAGKTSVSAAHLQGGCGMGTDLDDSVTDGWGRVHGVPGLYVADASLFPNCLEINPYLTIMALADRVAEAVRCDLSVPAGRQSYTFQSQEESARDSMAELVRSGNTAS